MAMSLTRRSFCKTAAAAASVLTTVSSPFIIGAEKNKKFRVMLIGCGWWGTNILTTAAASKTVEPVALVDVDSRQRDNVFNKVKELTGIEPQCFGDFREALEKVKPDIVINATPDHWHALITIAACKAGAHVYVEKPICHTINEGIAMLKTARDTNRVVQVGTHRRVSPHNISAMEFLKSGKLGKIAHVRAFVNYQGGAGKKEPDSSVPEGLDWNFWCGPAPVMSYNTRIHPRGFRWFLNYANGQLGDWGIHWLDQILWWSQEEQYPKSVASTGGRFIREDNTDAPDTQHVVYQFDKFDVTWEHRVYAGNPPEQHNIGLYFYGTKGVLHLGWMDGWSFYPSGNENGKAAEHQAPNLNQPDGQNIDALWADFIDSINKGKLSCCDIEKGHRSTTMALLGMLSLKLGRGIVWDGEKQTIPNDPEACKLLSREYRGEWKYPV